MPPTNQKLILLFCSFFLSPVIYDFKAVHHEQYHETQTKRMRLKNNNEKKNRVSSFVLLVHVFFSLLCSFRFVLVLRNINTFRWIQNTSPKHSMTMVDAVEFSILLALNMHNNNVINSFVRRCQMMAGQKREFSFGSRRTSVFLSLSLSLCSFAVRCVNNRSEPNSAIEANRK